MQTTKPTWFHYLSEVGRPILREAEKATDLLEKAYRLKNEADALFTKYNNDLEDLEATVKEHWTPDEIEFAKIQSMQANS